MNIIDRAAWGARPWNGNPYSVAPSERRYFVVHFYGGAMPIQTGSAAVQLVDNIHHDNGWAGIGYNFVIDQGGTVYEGRGWDLVGAHCPSRNRDGIGVMLCVGGNQTPTDAARNALAQLRAEAEQRAGRALVLGVHGDWYSTDCAGRIVSPWVHAGMPGTTTPQPAAPAGPGVLSISALRAAMLRDADQPNGTYSLARQQVGVLQGMLSDVGALDIGRGFDWGHYGSRTVEAVKRLQAWWPYTSQPDGWLGQLELTRLVAETRAGLYTITD